MESIIEVGPIEIDSEWDRAISGTTGELFQSSQWLSVLSAVYELQMLTVSEKRNGVMVAGLPFCFQDDILGARIKSLPFSDYVYPVVESIEQFHRLIEPLVKIGAPILIETGVDSPIAKAPGFEKFFLRVRHHIELDTDLDTLASRFSRLARRSVRRCSLSGIDIRQVDTFRDLEEFYGLHFRVRKYRHGLLCQPFVLFEAIWRQFFSDGRGLILGAYLEDQMVGGGFLLEKGDTLYFKFAAVDESYRKYGVSHAIMHRAIACAFERGLKRLDLGRSDLSQPGLIEFKRRFGAISTSLCQLRWVPEGYAPRQEAEQLLSDLSRLTADPSVPDLLTRRAGDILYRYFA